MGGVESGIHAMSYSPDQEVLVLVTGKAFFFLIVGYTSSNIQQY